MSTNVVMEALSPTMEEGRLVEWKKQEGEPVAVGDVLAEVETDKAVMELVARAGGTLLRQVVQAGATVPVSEVVAVIGEPGEETAAGEQGKGAAGQEPVSQAQPSPAPTEQAAPAPGKDRPEPMPRAAPAGAAEERPMPAGAAERTTPAGRQVRPVAQVAPNRQPVTGSGRVKASPLARRIAAERGIDIGAVAGSGPEGRVVARDLERPAAAAPPTTAPTPLPRGPEAPPSFSDVPLTQIRKTIAKRLAQSIGPIPTFYLTTEIDMERVAEGREALGGGGQRDGGAAEPKISFNDIVMKTVAMALRQHPACNAWWQDDHIRYWNEVHVSMAVAIEEGLITPVIRHTDTKSLREIAVESRDLAARARERRLKPDEYTGGTFSVSNLGMLDIDEFTAVINPPEAGILAVGRMVPTPVVHGGQVAVRRRMRVTMSCDHRVIDGATGAQFLKTVKGMLENPLAMVY
ncbi:MAG: 2-oxo acid dehydrogenase subunit E2 [Gemmatimonadales bacterium]|nr:2-oxo acid dehydrogenase subunit E2 [Gemmatimonadales bacterium]